MCYMRLLQNIVQLVCIVSIKSSLSLLSIFFLIDKNKIDAAMNQGWYANYLMTSQPTCGAIRAVRNSDRDTGHTAELLSYMKWHCFPPLLRKPSSPIQANGNPKLNINTSPQLEQCSTWFKFVHWTWTLMTWVAPSILQDKITKSQDSSQFIFLPFISKSPKWGQITHKMYNMYKTYYATHQYLIYELTSIIKSIIIDYCERLSYRNHMCLRVFKSHSWNQSCSGNHSI